ncbi:MAG: hypothetical protein ACJAS9_003772 [Polaribacter sp.]|jgi:hypothetical protein
MRYKVHDTNSKFSRIFKPIYQYLNFSKGDIPTVMIMGCQRSGTTLVSRVFDSFLNTKVYGEFSELSDDCTNKIRLNSIKDVNKKLENVKAKLIVMKPLVESQNADLLLSSIPNSNVVWMYRNFIDVASSDVLQFSDTAGHGNLQAIIKGDITNWRAERLTDEVVNLVKFHYSKHLSPLDCACLFWFARNSLYFSQDLFTNKNVSLWKYESLTDSPRNYFENLGCSLNVNLENYPYEKVISKDSVAKSIDSRINSDINLICNDMLSRLDSCELPIGNSLQL